MIKFNLDWIFLLTLVVSTVLPLIVAIVTTKLTSGRTKGIILAVLSFLLSILSGILDAIVRGVEYDLGANLLLFLGVFAWAVVSYFGVLRAAGPDGESITTKLTENVGRGRHAL